MEEHTTMNTIALIFITGTIGLILLKKLTSIFAHKCRIYIYDNERKRHYWGYVKYDRIQRKYSVFGQRGETTNRRLGEVQVQEDGFAWVHCWEHGYSPDESPYKLGYINNEGKIFTSTSELIGEIKPDSNGITHWYECYMKRHAEVMKINKPDIPFAHCVETGRFHKKNALQYTLIDRSAAFILLCQHQGYLKPQEEGGSLPVYSWKDTALPASIVFIGIYGIFSLFSNAYVLFPFLGTRISFLTGMMLLFFVIWGLMREIKIELILNEKPAGWWLALLGSNVGLNPHNWLIQLFSGIGITLSICFFDAQMLPLLLAIFIGVTVNRQAYPQHVWHVQTRFAYLPNTTLIPTEDEGETIRHYEWELDSPNRQRLTTTLQLHFKEAYIQELRKRNPFCTENNFYHHVNQMLNEEVDIHHLQIINQHIAILSNQNKLTMLESIQFILDFVQEPNIRYTYDKESTPYVEYLRYPDETLYDKTGDCDCKAMLAAALFHNAGLQVLYLTSKTHAAVAVECNPTWFGSQKNPYIPQGLLLYKNKHYYFCETTGDHFRVGDVNGDLSQFTTIIEVATNPQSRQIHG